MIIQKRGKAINQRGWLITYFLLLICLSIDPLKGEFMRTAQKRHLVTVFIHGTLLPVPSWRSLKKVFKSKKKEVGSRYQQYIDSLRFNSFLRHQPMGGDGLTRIEQSKPSHHTQASFITKDLFESAHRTKLSAVYDSFTYYTFSWNGRLSNRHRKKAAKKLYEEIIKVKGELELSTGLPVDFDLHCHSHAGNVALNLALIEQEKQKNLKIAHLVLLGTPIQKETVSFCNADIFESVYNVYSRGDGIQIADMFSTCTYGSYRRFDQCDKSMNVLPKVRHIECTIGKFKPSHAELWLYKGAGNFLSRKYLDIHPIPVFAHLPCLIYDLDLHVENDLHLNICKNGDLFTYEVTSKNGLTEEALFSATHSSHLFAKAAILL